MITKDDIINVIHEALDEMVEEYNDNYQSYVALDLEDPDVITIDGGNVHGAWNIRVAITEV